MALERVPADIRAEGGVARMVSLVSLGFLSYLNMCFVE
jgi:pyridoxal biosynthesis lyase PdxS